MPNFFFAWVSEGDAFDSVAHAVEDERVFSIEISQSEGEFAQLKIEVQNPKVGLLAAGRNLWCWLSWNNGDGVEPLFTGRLVGIPSRLSGEVVELQFLARPTDYLSQRDDLADTLRVLPWYDPVWIQEGADDADTVLETRAARWHVDRTTLEVTASDIISGEAGTIEIATSEHFYDDLDVSYSETPIKQVDITGTVTWSQKGTGDVDITRNLVKAFKATGSLGDYPIVTSLTGDGLLSSWPAAGTSINGGWTVGDDATIEDVGGKTSKTYVKRYSAPSSASSSTIKDAKTSGTAISNATDIIYSTWEFTVTVGSYKIYFPVHYEAERQRSEIVTASVVADVQNLVVDPDADDIEKVELSSTRITEPIDDDDAMPIGDLRRNSYFKTNRGAQSFEYLLLLARAKLLAKARAVEIKFVTTWDTAYQITCRHNVHLVDDRLPYGEAVGKVTSYKLTATGDDGGLTAEVTIACTIGYGTALAAAAVGEPVYVDDDYVEDGYQQRTGAVTELIESALQYQSFDDLDITDDDKVDLFNMTPNRVIDDITITGGLTAQRAAINHLLGTADTPPDPAQALTDTPTIVELELVPVTGGDFSVTFDVDVSMLVVPQTINLEAA